MDIAVHTDRVAFRHDGKPFAEYILNDRFKPHFRSLRTPAGHETTLVSPGDHRHHKGLMYALRCEDLNFWEERPGDGQCGVQEVCSTDLLPERDGIFQEILWKEESGALETYRETRTIRVRRLTDASAFVLSWHTSREALRDHRLIKSPASIDLPDGRRINYHGLGIRLPWMWRFPSRRSGGVEVNRAPADPLDARGTTAPSVGFWGLIDGQWKRTVASVTITQQQTFTWFVLKRDFPYLSIGPSNIEEFTVGKGDVSEESYSIEIADRPTGFGLEQTS